MRCWGPAARPMGVFKRSGRSLPLAANACWKTACCAGGGDSVPTLIVYALLRWLLCHLPSVARASLSIEMSDSFLA